MSKDTDTGPVREARVAAKKLVRKGATTYQQALDVVARERGHANWTAFLRSEIGGHSPARTPNTNSARARRRMVDITETAILEEAASTKQMIPWIPLWIMPPASAFMNTTIFSGAIFGTGAMLLGLAAAFLVLIATIAGRLSTDGLVRPRHALSTWVTPFAFGIWMIGVASMVVTLMRGGDVNDLIVDSLTHTSPPMAIYAAGLVAYYASTRAHRAMTLAKPDSVRPKRLPDVTIPASGAMLSRKAGTAIRTITYGGIGLAFLGLAGLAWTIVDMFVRHEVDMGLAGKSMGLVMAGVIIAMVFTFGFNMDRAHGDIPMEDESRRAARARRFLSAGRRMRHG